MPPWPHSEPGKMFGPWGVRRGKFNLWPILWRMWSKTNCPAQSHEHHWQSSVPCAMLHASHCNATCTMRHAPCAMHHAQYAPCRCVMRDLASTLRAIGRKGADAFYGTDGGASGIAEAMAAAAQATGGSLTLADLRGYAPARSAAALCRCSMPLRFAAALCR